MQVSKIYQTAVNNGAQILENGCAYAIRQSKHNPNRYIQRVITPNGSYTIQISENGTVTKRTAKTVLNETSSITDSWDFSKQRGVYLSNVSLNEGKSLMSRVFDKISEKNIKQDGFIYLLHFGKPDKYMTEVKTLNGLTSTAKPFSPMAWLNEQFYKVFNK